MDGKNGGDTGKGSPGTSGGSAGEAGDDDSAGSVAATGSDDGGGSSPLVPILIAIAVLAAASVGVLIYRQRRDRGGSLSPEAS